MRVAGVRLSVSRSTVRVFCVSLVMVGLGGWGAAAAAMRRTLCLGALSRSWRWATALARPTRTSLRPFSASGRPRT